MAIQLTCDICRKETTKITAKMFYQKKNASKGSTYHHSQYSHHLDIGICCEDRVMRLFNWTERAKRDRGNGDAVEKSAEAA